MDTLRISQLNALTRELLEISFPEELWVVGEIQGYRLHAKSGHMYFDLVEKTADGDQQYLAKVNCAFFCGSVIRWRESLRQQGLAGFAFADGMEVRIRARVDFFVKEGRYQLIVSMVDPAYSLGALARKRAQTIETLRREGLLELNRRLEFPRLALTVGLITSAGSAAYNDFISVLRSSGLGFAVRLFDAQMQGVGTSTDVIRGLSLLAGKVDVIVITRGGGARMDLVYFDDIGICRAIAVCPTPVITGIGHEIDLSVADMVASEHRVTPTDAARFLVDQAQAEADFVAESEAMLKDFVNAEFPEQRAALQRQATGLSHLADKMVLGAKTALGQRGSELGFAAGNVISEQRRGLDVMQINLEHAAGERIREGQSRIGHLREVLNLLDPAEMFRRGYAALLDENGRGVHSVADVKVGRKLTAVVADGRITSVVEEVEEL